MLIRKYVIPLLAVAGVALAVRVVITSNQPTPSVQPVAQPATSPFQSQIAGAGLVEASTRNIAVGTNLPGVVIRVSVEAGDMVKQGDELFTIDDRATRAEIAVREAAVRQARRALERLESLPRPEEIPPLEARLAEALAQLEDARDQLARFERVEDRRAVTEEELKRRSPRPTSRG
ncbi:biotin/lipoyl-binding protein [Leptolyngbya sp. 15MV]|nr:biotin/lipoyl-binding protein [Leptolyngbya sp. 15MV]